MYQLKNSQEGFEVVDGPDAGKSFRRGKVYTDVPEGVTDRFEPVCDSDDSIDTTKTSTWTTGMSAIADTTAPKEGDE